MKKLVIFDMDGTTLNTLKDLHNAVNYALNTCGYPEQTAEKVRKSAGYGVRRLLEQCSPTTLTPKEKEHLFNVFYDYYEIHTNDYTKPYDGIIEMMQTCKKEGILMALVSNKLDEAVQELCKMHFAPFLVYAVGEKAGVRKKPAPDSVNTVLEKLGIAKEDAVYVGDSEVDIDTANNASMDVIGVTWGFRDRDYLETLHPTRLIDSPKQLYDAVTSL